MVEAKCPKCKKLVFPTPDWVYTDKDKFYCSWTCFNHRNDNAKQRWREVEQYTEDGVVLRTFRSANNAAEFVGVNTRYMLSACKNGTKLRNTYWRFKDEESEEN